MTEEKSPDKTRSSYNEKVSSRKTWSGLPLNDFYGPWIWSLLNTIVILTIRGSSLLREEFTPTCSGDVTGPCGEVCGYGTPEDTNDRLKFFMKQGVGGLNVIPDNPSIMGIDSDHPRAADDVGVQGVPMCSLEDIELLMRDIPMDKISMSLIISSTQTPVTLAQYLALAEQRGVSPANLAGTTQNDSIHCRYAGFEVSSPLDLALKTAVDVIEYCTLNMPRWYPINVNLYDLREQGLDAPQEIAFGFSLALLYIEKALERGLDIDSFAPRFAFYCSVQMDFFEEIAKLRAARRIWARLMKDRFGAKDPRSLKFKFGVHTAGCSLIPHQPENNIIRVAYEAMAAVLAGVQSLHCCSYDEPISLPTEESVRLALRTQQILAYETGVAKVADPLGGSYYLEKLTEQIEEQVGALMEKVEQEGGMRRLSKPGGSMLSSKKPR